MHELQLQRPPLFLQSSSRSAPSSGIPKSVDQLTFKAIIEAVLTLPGKQEESGKLSTEVYNDQYIPYKSALFSCRQLCMYSRYLRHHIGPF